MTACGFLNYLWCMAWNPAHHIICKLGGEKAVAELLGIHETAPYRWTYPRSRKGSQGVIPARHIPKLIAAAKHRRKRLRFEDFFQTPTEV